MVDILVTYFLTCDNNSLINNNKKGIRFNIEYFSCDTKCIKNYFVVFCFYFMLLALW